MTHANQGRGYIYGGSTLSNRVRCVPRQMWAGRRSFLKPGERERPFLGSLAALADGEVGACIREAASRAKLHSRERPVVSGRPDADGLARSGKWTPSLGIFQTYREHRSHVVEVLDLTLEGDGIWLTWED